MTKYFEKDKISPDSTHQSVDLSPTFSSSRLYLDFFSLRESPFSITPDPEFLYMTSSHKAVLEKILYGIRARMGFLLLIGEVGTGKTTLCRLILDEIKEMAETVYIINPSLSDMDLIKSILEDLGIGIPSDASKKELLHHLNRFLLVASKEKPVVIIIDDAQTMTLEGMETLRLLSNLETDKEKLIQLVIAGQQELLGILSRSEIRQLQQRIAIKCELELLKKTEVQGYILHRLFVAGDKGNIRFTVGAIDKIHKASRGIPRLINKICDYALTAGYVSNSYEINKRHIKQALNELKGNLREVEDRSSLDVSLSVGKRIRFELALLAITVLLAVLSVTFKNSADTAVSESIPERGVLFSSPILPEPVNSNSSELIDNVILDVPQESVTVPGDVLKQGQGPESMTIENPGGFILQLASFKTLKDTLKSVSIYKEKDIDVHWNPVDLGEKGLWYRIYTGMFPTKEAAADFKNIRRLAEGMIIYAPWTIQAAVSENKTELMEKCSQLKSIGFDCVLSEDGDSGYRITNGAFVTSEGAMKMAMELTRNGFDAEIISR